MLLTVQEFRHRVDHRLPQLVADLQDLTGRCGESEAEAWQSSLPAAARAFSHPSLQQLHLYFGGKGNLSLEYRLPSASAWCDMVLLGAHQQKPSVVIVELKHWQTRTDKPGPVEGLMERQGSSALHPSDQVRGYAQYCQRFHSTVAYHQAAVHGCVLFTRDYFCDAYRQSPNDHLVANYPCFTVSPEDVERRLPKFFAERLTIPDEQFAMNFEKGRYRQDRNFCRQVAEQLKNPQSSPFELLDSQRRALAECRAAVQPILSGNHAFEKRKVIFVYGPPGSGKSVVAARLWADLVLNTRLPKGNVVFTTTSQSQNSNWRHFYKRAANDAAAGGMVIKANEYIPCTIGEITKWKKQFPALKFRPGNWRTNLQSINALRSEGPRTKDYHFLVSIVDEAHALINPEHNDGRGMVGFAVAAGPQAYHILRGSTISIFFMDPDQSFRERETTTVDDIKAWAKELGAEDPIEVSLEECQFRCGGSKEYVQWVEDLLDGRSTVSSNPVSPGLQVKEAAASYGKDKSRFPLDIQIFENPLKIEAALRKHIDGGATARLAASYAREWKTKGLKQPHTLPPAAMDFHENVLEDGHRVTWSKIWNHVPKGDDYSPFVQAPVGTLMHDDPLCEVGCPYAIRGFDFDYIGLLWLKDLVWRDNDWRVNPDQLFETGLKNTISKAKKAKDPNSREMQKLLEKIKQAYRILLTRAMKGVYIWFEDTETEEAFRGFLKG